MPIVWTGENKTQHEWNSWYNPWTKPQAKQENDTTIKINKFQ